MTPNKQPISPTPRRSARRPQPRSNALERSSPATPALCPTPAPIDPDASVAGTTPAAFEFDGIADTTMLRSLACIGSVRAPERRSSTSRYENRDLKAIAEMGYHYLLCGGHRLAKVIFEGLVAIEPNEPYYALALGLTLDHLGEKEESARAYLVAAKLDPKDARPDLNLAELAIEMGDRTRASRLLRSGLEKARARGDEELACKAQSLLDLLFAPPAPKSISAHIER
jgi:tetratricopeptide (TPR) repeat protein